MSPLADLFGDDGDEVVHLGAGCEDGAEVEGRGEDADDGVGAGAEGDGLADGCSVQRGTRAARRDS